MSIPNPNEPQGFPENFDLSSLENEDQRMLRADFEQVEARNRQAIEFFVPERPNSYVDLEFETSRGEEEAREQPFTNMLRVNMLKRLGIWFEKDEPIEGEMVVKYENGDSEWIMPIDRPDGSKVPVLTKAVKIPGTDNYELEHMRLVSNDLAGKAVERMERRYDELIVDERLQQEFGIDPEFTRKANFSYEDKRDMLRSYDEIKSIETTLPDLTVLDKSRKRLVKGMLPRTKYWMEVRDRKFKQKVRDYASGVREIIESRPDDKKFAEDVIASERLKRLSALNEQLKARNRTVNLGLIAVTGSLSTVGGAAGAFTGWLPTLPLTTTSGAALGAISGALIGLEQAMYKRGRGKYVLEFSYLRPEADFGRQLAQEYEVARANLRLTRFTH